MGITTAATHGTEEASEGSLDQGASSSLQDSLAAQDETSRIRPRKVYLSPALIWLEEEGLPTAEKEAEEKAIEGEMDKEAVMKRAMGKWKRMSVEEKAVWRAKAKEEGANTNQE